MAILVMSIGTGIKGKEDESKRSQGHGIAFAIKEARADKLYFLCTKESRDTLNYVEQFLPIDKKNIFKNKEIIELSYMTDINELIKEMKPLFDKLKDEKDIIVVPTFGTKMITSTLTILAVLNNTKIYSVEGERQYGIVRQGKERWESQNYYRIMDISFLKEAVSYFNKYRFNIANECISKINSDSISLNNKTYNKEEVMKIIDGYQKWDLFDHDNAYELINNKFLKIEKIDKNKRYICTLKNIDDNDIIKKYIYILADLINNAKRRIEENKYDDAVARLYRAIELFSQIKLKEYGFDDLNEDQKKEFNIDNIKLKGIGTGKYEKYADETGKIKLGLEMKFELLNDLGFIKAKEIYLENNHLKNLLKKRNNSILAHGLKPVDKETANDLFEQINKYVKDIYPDIENIMSDATFLKL